jgi:DNA-binding transcriptional ArsR family regulator
MKIVRLLGALAVFSLLMAPAHSEQITKICTCTSGSGSCHSTKGMSCCCSGHTDKTSSSQGCRCPDLISLSTSTEAYDPGYSYFGESSSRPYSRQGQSASSSDSFGESKNSGSSPPYANNGPPDIYVVEYLPPSAKQVFDVLATNGPLTQKDIISKTDLPPRTVRYALSRLKGEDILEERFCFQDARQSIYSLAMTGPK